MSIDKELESYLQDLARERDEQRRAYIRARADGAINLATACGLMDKQTAAEWQNKMITAVFTKGGRSGGKRNSNRQ